MAINRSRCFVCDKGVTFGNNVSTSYTLSPVNGRLMGVSTLKSGTTLRSWGYAYLADGNLQRRSDLLAAQHERFEYDNMDRIKRWVDADAQGKALAGGWSVDYKIDDFGSITQRKFNAGSSTGGTSQTANYTIDPNSHRVTAASLWSGSYTYDANGNQTGRPDSEVVTYTAFDLPKKITGPRPADFDYDAFGTRARKQKTGTSNFTIYVAGLYEKRVTGLTKEHVFYVMGPRGVVAQVTRPEGSTEDTKYLHSDNLGSVDTVTSAAGGIAEQTKRDPFGNAVSNFNQPTLPTTITASTKKVRLGFTGHEQDDELGMINMRGRMFDARLGRFLTPDPVVGSGRGHNRYSYVRNNPLRFIDPTGLVPSCAGASDDVECEVVTVKDPSSLSGQHQCDPNDDGTYTCAVTRPKPAPLPKPDAGVDAPSGTDSSGTGSGSGGGSGGSQTGGSSSGPTPPHPPGRALAEDCTPQCSGQGQKWHNLNGMAIWQLGPAGVEAVQRDYDDIDQDAVLDRTLDIAAVLGGVVGRVAGVARGARELARPASPANTGGLRSAEEAGIASSDAQRIQNAADRTQQRIAVVGSRAAGTAGPNSDWDYILSGASRQRQSASSSLPRGTAGGRQTMTGEETGIDIFQDYNPKAVNYSPLRADEPHVIFTPWCHK